MSLRKIGIRLALPLVWRRSQKRMAQALEEFSATEVGSAWQSLYAMKYVEYPALRANLLQHALEEIGHGARFHAAAEAFAETPLARPIEERDPLLSDPKSRKALVDFFAYEHVGEKDVHDEFSAYASAAPRPELKQLFLSLREDEKGHALFTRRALEQTATIAGVKVTHAVWKARLKRAYGAWLRFSKRFGEIPPTILLTVLYFVFGPLLRAACRNRIEKSCEFENANVTSADSSAALLGKAASA